MDSSLITVAILIPLTAVIAYLTFQPKQQINELLEQFDEGSGKINSKSKEGFDISGTYQGHEVNFKFQPSKEIVTGAIKMASHPSSSYTVTRSSALDDPEQVLQPEQEIGLVVSPEKGLEQFQAMCQHESLERLFSSSFMENGFDNLTVTEEDGVELNFLWQNSAIKSNYLNSNEFQIVLMALNVLSH